MTSSSPSSAGLSPVGATFSEVSTPSSSPATPTFRSRPFASMAITELVISESQYVGTIKRVANALGKAAENTVIAGRKDSVTLRTLTDRWNDILRMHVKFHDDVVAVNEDLRETAGLINSLLVTLEPILIDHGRDLSGALKKLIRRDQNSEHTFAEWNAALRQPFEHLAMYDEWLQRIDPQSKFSKDYRSHISGLTYKIKMVSEANQHPRNVLRRLSTIAKGVIKRRSSGQILSLPPPETPTTPTTPQSYATSESFTATAMSPKEIQSAITVSPSSSTSPCLPPLPQTVENLAITETNSQTESVTTGQRQAEVKPLDEPSPKEEKEVLNDDTATFSEKQLPPTPVVADELLSVNKQLKHRSSATSDLSSTGTLTMTSSSASIHSKSSTTDTLLARHTSLARQQFLKERDARKATLRVGTHELIQAKAESLQSPTFRSRPSVETMRVLVHPRESEKPPVKSLINFWEQVSDPLEV
ncbi:hypothetical protein BGZ82_007063 [Podila clonocystis]|nr:hypothetical protein BGZ82_007063 [Podila clonocystis]